ncbi:MAG: hypothetical protein EOM59_01950 [Clostridia bacterium]|nr:hypothetical protein [Clostridia bacterium]
MFTKRLKVSLITGVLLGVVCIIGASVRSGFQSDVILLLSLWYNRLILGLMIGLIGAKLPLSKAITRGAFLGLIVSFSFYISTGFTDIVSFLAGVLYGMIIEYVAIKYDTE